MTGDLTLSAAGGIEGGTLSGYGTLSAPCSGCPGLTGAVTLSKTGSAVVLKMAADFTFAYVGVSGDVVFSSSGGVDSFTLTGDGTTPSSVCTLCPSLAGKVTLSKPSAGGAVSLSMSASATLGGFTVTGTVVFTSSGGVQSFTLSGSATSVASTLYDGVIKAFTGGSISGSDLIVFANVCAELLERRVLDLVPFSVISVPGF